MYEHRRTRSAEICRMADLQSIKRGISWNPSRTGKSEDVVSGNPGPRWSTPRCACVELVPQPRANDGPPKPDVAAKPTLGAQNAGHSRRQFPLRDPSVRQSRAPPDSAHSRRALAGQTRERASQPLGQPTPHFHLTGRPLR